MIVTQAWTHRLSMMQQTVLLTAVRGPDGMPKYTAAKKLLRWYRRCILLSAMDGQVLSDPFSPNGGSFTGPSYSLEMVDNETWQQMMDEAVAGYIKECDAISHHFQVHLMHAIQIVGYKHPDTEIREWWERTYVRIVHTYHLWPESEAEMDRRLGDSREQWLERSDKATVA